MATTHFRQGWYPPISKQPTAEELARHLRLIYQALNDHDTAIVKLHEQASTGSQPSSTPAPTMQFSPTEVATQKIGTKKFKLP